MSGTNFTQTVSVKPSKTRYFSSTGSDSNGTGSLNSPWATPNHALANMGTPAANARVEAVGTIATSVDFTQTADNQWVGTSVRMPSGRDLNLGAVDSAGFDRIAISNAAINTSLTISGGTGHKFDNCEIGADATVSLSGFADEQWMVWRDCDFNGVEIILPQITLDNPTAPASITLSRCSDVNIVVSAGWMVVLDNCTGTVSAPAGSVAASNCPNLRRTISGSGVDISPNASCSLASSIPSSAGMYALNYNPTNMSDITGATLEKGDVVYYIGFGLALRVSAYESIDTVNIGGTTRTKSDGGWGSASSGGISYEITNAGLTYQYASGAESTDNFSSGTVAVKAPVGTTAVLNGVVSGAAGFSLSGGGTVKFGGANTFSGGTAVTTKLTLHNPKLGTGAVSFAGETTVLCDAISTVSGAISGAGSLVKTGSESLILTGNNSFTGGTNVKEGTVLGVFSGINLAFASSGVTLSGGTASVTRSSASANAPFIAPTGTGKIFYQSVGAAVNQYMNAQGSANIPNIDITWGSTPSRTVDENGSTIVDAPVNLAGHSQTFKSISGSYRIYNNLAPLTITLSYGGGSYTGIINDAGAGSAISIVKNGAGTQTFKGTNTYSGATTVNGGTLAVEGSSTSSHTIASGAAVSAGMTTTGSVGSLTFSALASKYIVNAISVTSASKLACATLTAANGFTIDALGAMDSGVYPIMTKTSGYSGTPTLGTNTTGRAVSFAWSGNTLNMTLV